MISNYGHGFGRRELWVLCSIIGNMALLSVINDGSAPNAPNCWASIMDLHAQGLS
jgi:hypothetical protein